MEEAVAGRKDGEIQKGKQGAMEGKEKIEESLASRRTAAEIAAETLREFGESGVMTGDAYLLHQIAEKLGMKHEGYLTERKVLNRIDRSNQGEFVKRIVGLPERGRGRLRVFDLL